MRKLTVLFLILLGGWAAMAQSPAAKTAAITAYDGAPLTPFPFEPYRAEYKFGGDLFGLEFPLFDFSTRVFELSESWEETQQYRFRLPDAPEINVTINSSIDRANGLLKKISIPGETAADRNEIRFDDGRITIFSTDGKRSKELVYDVPDKIYPCSFSTAFLGYLPLAADFAGTFSCFSAEDSGDEPVFLIEKMTLRVVGTETITTAAGRFDCYRLVSDVETVKRLKDRKVRELVKRKTPKFDEEKFWNNMFGTLWIDRRTRKFVLGEIKFKNFGRLTTEMQKIDTRNL